MTYDELLTATLTLSIEDRIQLADASFDSVEPHDFPITPASEPAEILRRARELDANPNLAISGEEFWRRMKEQ